MANYMGYNGYDDGLDFWDWEVSHKKSEQKKSPVTALEAGELLAQSLKVNTGKPTPKKMGKVQAEPKFSAEQIMDLNSRLSKEILPGNTSLGMQSGTTTITVDASKIKSNPKFGLYGNSNGIEPLIGDGLYKRSIDPYKKTLDGYGNPAKKVRLTEENRYDGPIPVSYFEEEQIKPREINKSEEVFLNYNELADELAKAELIQKHGKYDDIEMIGEWTELSEKYVTLILKHERTDG